MHLNYKVIAVEIPDELAEAFERLIGGIITGSEDKDTISPEDDQSDGGDTEDEDSEPTEVQELVMDIAFTLGSRASDYLISISLQVIFLMTGSTCTICHLFYHNRNSLN